MVTVISTMPIRFNHSPPFAICGICTYPEPYAIAFGGVATGSMNAHVAAIATGIASSIGSIPIPTATAVATGRKVAAAAVLDVSSVRNRTPAAAIITTSTTGRPPICSVT